VIEFVNRDPGISVLVLTGSGAAFSSGGDIKAMRRRTGFSVARRRDCSQTADGAEDGKFAHKTTLGDDLALELSKREQNIKRQPSHRVGSVERLRDTDKGTACFMTDIDDPGKVGQAAGQPINLLIVRTGNIVDVGVLAVLVYWLVFIRPNRT